MAKQIIIVGGLQNVAERSQVLDELKGRSKQENIEWDWISCDEKHHFEPHKKPFNHLLEKLRLARRVAADPDNRAEEIIVVKLSRLHGRSQSQLYQVYRDPVLVPPHVIDADGLIEWLFSEEANLVPRREWWATCQEAAITAILAKLIRNKSWNKNTQGHNWTKEEDLLGQAPVMRSDCQEIATAAQRMIGTLEDNLLLKKGSGHGATSREWCIRLDCLSQVKQAILQRTLAPLTQLPGLSRTIENLAGNERPYRLDQGVVTERVRQICRAAH